MPGKGTPRYTVRLPDELLALVEVTIARRNAHTDREPWDLSGFIRAAIFEKLAKMERSRRRAPRRSRTQPGQQEPPPNPDDYSTKGDYLEALSIWSEWRRDEQLGSNAPNDASKEGVSEDEVAGELGCQTPDPLWAFYGPGWPRCPFCDLPVMDGKATCGRTDCVRIWQECGHRTT